MSKIQIQNLEELEANVLRGVFPYVRLLSEGNEVIVSAKKTRNKPENIRAHWNFIRQKIEVEMPAGTYVIECAYDAARKNVHQYVFDKKPDYVPTARPLQDLPPKTPVKMDKDFIQLIKENAELTSENKFLVEQNKLLSNRVNELEAALEESLNDQEENETALSESSNLVQGITQIWTQAAPMLDNFFALKNRELELKYGNNNRANPGNIPAKIPVNQMKQNTGIDTNNHIYQEQYKTLAYMFDNGQSDQANEVLAALFKTNKALYDQLCTDLNLEDSE